MPLPPSQLVVIIMGFMCGMINDHPSERALRLAEEFCDLMTEEFPLDEVKLETTARSREFIRMVRARVSN